MILCKNCKFFGSFREICTHEKSKYNTEETLVYGDYKYRTAKDMRGWSVICGPKAKYFVPRKPFWKRLLKRK